MFGIENGGKSLIQATFRAAESSAFLQKKITFAGHIPCRIGSILLCLAELGEKVTISVQVKA